MKTEVKNSLYKRIKSEHILIEEQCFLQQLREESTQLPVPSSITPIGMKITLERHKKKQKSKKKLWKRPSFYITAIGLTLLLFSVGYLLNYFGFLFGTKPNLPAGHTILNSRRTISAQDYIDFTGDLYGEGLAVISTMQMVKHTAI